MEDLSQLLLPRLSVCVKELLQAPTEGGWGHPSLWRVWARAKLALSTPPCPPQQTTDHHSWIGVHTAGGVDVEGGGAPGPSPPTPSGDRFRPLVSGGWHSLGRKVWGLEPHMKSSTGQELRLRLKV